MDQAGHQHRWQQLADGHERGEEAPSDRGGDQGHRGWYGFASGVPNLIERMCHLGAPWQ